MGYDQHQPPTSSGTLVAVIGVGLVLASLGIVVVAAVGLFWVRASTQQAQVVEMEQRAISQLHRAEAEAQRAHIKAERAVAAQLAQARLAATTDPILNFELNLDREGNASVDGEKIGFDELRARLLKLKDETSNVFVVHLNADPECSVKHIVPMLDVCHEVGDIDVRVVASSMAADPRASERDGGNQ